jgi:DNA gyrase subunit A
MAKQSSILNDENVLLSVMKTEFAELKEQYADTRRTEIQREIETIEEEDLIKDEQIVITISMDKIDLLIKSVLATEYTTQNRGTKGKKSATLRDEEVTLDVINASTKDSILFFTNKGRCHIVKAYKIPIASRTAKGKSLNNYLNFDQDEMVISTIVAGTKEADESLLFVTRNGIIKRLSVQNLSARMSVTKVLSFKEDDSLVTARLVKDTDQVLIMTALGSALRMKMDSEGQHAIRPMGRTAAGVRGIKLRGEDYVVDMVVVDDESAVMTITENGLGKRTKASSFNAQNRGGGGVIAQKITKNTGKVVAALNVSDNDEVFIVTEQGLLIRIEASAISVVGRSAVGVKIINLNEGDKVGSMSKYSSEDEPTQTAE